MLLNIMVWMPTVRDTSRILRPSAKALPILLSTKIERSLHGAPSAIRAVRISQSTSGQLRPSASTVR